MLQVTAVVLTYNRASLLERCLQALLEQTRLCDQIIVINNASTDNTTDVLKRFRTDRLQVRTLVTNIGAAGGFRLAMLLGHETGADYIWVMDDDVLAASTALAELLAAYATLSAKVIEAPYVISLARSPDGLVTNVPELDRRLNALSYENWPDLLFEGLVPVTRSTFVSILIARATLDRYGLPLAKMFIWGEDSEYTLRVTREASGYMAVRSRVEHVRGISGSPDIRAEDDPVRIGWYRFQIRNNIYLSRRYRGSLSTISYILRTSRLAGHLVLCGHMRKARVVLHGILLGITFNPKTVQDADSLLQPGSPRETGHLEQYHEN